MGTRNLTMVVAGGEMKVAQYGQWDGYPEGQGRTVLSFLRRLVRYKKVGEFKNRVLKLRFFTQEEVDAFYATVRNFSEEQFREHSLADVFDRSTAADLLNLIMQNPSITKLHNSEKFAGDGLFCEYAYLIDMDKEVLECYKGFFQDTAPHDQRFAKYNNYEPLEPNQSARYGPIRLVAEFPFNKLPSFKKFEAAIDPPDED